MRKVTCIIHQHYLDDVIQSLHENGLMQIIDISRNESKTHQLNPGKSDEETTLLSEYENRLTTLITILNNHKQKKTGLKAMLKPDIFEKQTVEQTSLEELYSYTESVIGPIESIIRTSQQEYDQITEKIDQLKEHQKQTSWFTAFQFSLDDLGRSEYLIIKAGKTSTLPALQKAIEEEKYLTLYSQPLVKGKNPEWSVLLVGHITQMKTVERLTAEHLQEVTLPKLSLTPKEAQKQLQQQIKQAQQKKQKIHSSLQELANHHLSQLFSTREQIQLEHIQKQVPSQLATTEQTILIQGWVLASNNEKLQSQLNQITNDHIIFESKKPSTNPDNPPTHLDTPPWAESFKTLLSLFAIPKYNELNPTIMMGIFFIIFFGIMLGDAGYGLIILLLSLFAYLKFGNMSPMIKNWGFMGICLGLVTTLVGFLTYSIFGNLIHLIIQGESTQLMYQFSVLSL
ncbi:MAG: hypothetical protein KGY65_03475, partial [Candidatus Thermoplasmatota archaeon]|nr:hypothetical protein [Candidatus Thermoplasmatota archaeon]